MTIKAVSYARISSLRQKEGIGIARQIEMTKAYCDRMGFEFDESLQFTDEGISAFSGKNKLEGKLSLIFQMIEDGRIKPGTQLIVEAVDRISREESFEALGTFAKIINADVTIHTAKDGQIYDRETIRKNPASLHYLLAVIATANIESENKRRYQKATHTKKVAAATADPVNFKMTCKVPAWVQATRVKDKGIVFGIFPDRVAIVKDIFDMFVNQNMGRGAIAANLTKRNKLTFSGKSTWSGGCVQKITDNPAVIGHLQPKMIVFDKVGKKTRVPTGDVLKGYYPAIISEALWVRARRKSDEKSVVPKNKGGRKGTVFNNLFSGIPTCEVCGGVMRYKNPGPSARGQVIFRCARDCETHGECNPTRFPYRDIEAITITLFGAIKLTQQNAPDDLEEKIANLRLQEEAVQTAIVALDDKLDSDTTGIISNMITKRVAKLGELQAERQKIEAEQIAPMGDTIADAMKAFANFRATSATLPDEDRFRARSGLNYALKTVIETMSFNNDNVCHVKLRDGQKYAIALASAPAKGKLVMGRGNLRAYRVG